LSGEALAVSDKAHEAPALVSDKALAVSDKALAVSDQALASVSDDVTMLDEATCSVR